jgi:hypothetical protein
MDEKDALTRPFFVADITQAPLPFNKDKQPRRPAGALSAIHVAEKPRFRHARKEAVNHEAPREAGKGPHRGTAVAGISGFAAFRANRCRKRPGRSGRKRKACRAKE